VPGPTDAPPTKAAPIAVFGGMIVIALIGLIVVLVYNCRREEPYLDPTPIEPGQAGHVYPPTTPPTAPPSSD
jgi:hypothetical protein